MTEIGERRARLSQVVPIGGVIRDRVGENLIKAKPWTGWARRMMMISFREKIQGEASRNLNSNSLWYFCSIWIGKMFPLSRRKRLPLARCAGKKRRHRAIMNSTKIGGILWFFFLREGDFFLFGRASMIYHPCLCAEQLFLALLFAQIVFLGWKSAVIRAES